MKKARERTGGREFDVKAGEEVGGERVGGRGE